MVLCSIYPHGSLFDIPTWFSVSRQVALLVLSCAMCERVFSSLNGLIGNNQRLLIDALEFTVMSRVAKSAPRQSLRVAGLGSAGFH